MRVFKAEPSYWQYNPDNQLGLIDRLFFNRIRQKADFHRRMFDEDFARLFRSKNRRGGNLFEIVTNDDRVVQKLLGNVKTRHAPRSVDETVRELVSEIAQTLIRLGKAYYFLHEDNDQEEIHIVPLSSVGIMRLFGRHFQCVPKRNERHWDRENEELPRELRILDETKVMRFDMPTSMKRVLAAQNRTLGVLDKFQFRAADFHRQATYEDPNPTNHFDFRVWNDIQERALYRATRITGWSCRKFDSTKRSDFFDCHRMIRFRRNQILLRDDILKQLGCEFSRIGKSYRADFSIEISGTNELPSIAHLNKLAARLIAENVGFNEVLNYYYER
ncbi:hypothetical protein [Pseudomonas sp. OV226]|uniref:hypothetical protein n=1 Tax=Pseudomonas sp. OV226 TaxID=2135588 RepID=UPI000D6C60BF|nr:hypothetical protein [Pseudomonas sp. OV226]PWK31443.1 hypothetical protein C7534_12393 [Pseudomonas sp. OV226]